MKTTRAARKQKTGMLRIGNGTEAVSERKPEHVLARSYRVNDAYTVNLLEFPSLQAWLDQADSAFPECEYDKNDPWTYGKFGKLMTDKALRSGTSPDDSVRATFRDRLDTVRAILAKIGNTQRMKSAKRQRKPAWCGGRLNVQKYNLSKATGKPTPTFQRMARRYDVPVKKIAINTSMSGNMKPEAFAQVAASAAAIVEALQKAGYGVQLDICWSTTTSQNQKTWNVTRCPIKRADEPVDIEKILSLACPGFLRDYSFRLRSAFLHPTASAVMAPFPEINEELLNYDLILNHSWKNERVIQGELEKFLTVKGD